MKSLRELLDTVSLHITLANILNDPEGKHIGIVNDFYKAEMGDNSEPLEVKLDFILQDWHRFDRYLLKLSSESDT